MQPEDIRNEVAGIDAAVVLPTGIPASQLHSILSCKAGSMAIGPEINPSFLRKDKRVFLFFGACVKEVVE